MNVEFLAPKPIQEGSDLPSQWTRFKDEFELFLTAAEKSEASDKIKIAILLRCIGPRGNDVFKSFTFTDGKSKEVYKDVLEKFDAFCTKNTNKIAKRHQLLSTKQGCLSIDEYITSLHKVARDCDLGDMYDAFMLQALLLGINDERVRRRLFEEAELQLEDAIKRCRIAEASAKDLKLVKTETEESVHALKQKGKHTKPDRSYSNDSREPGATGKSRATCSSCGTSHPPRKCPAYGQKCHGCGKLNHYKKLCRSKRQVNQVTEEGGFSEESDDSLMCVQVVRKNKKLLSAIATGVGGKETEIQYQLDTGASCNVFNYEDYCAIGKPKLKDKCPSLQLFDGSTVKAMGQCQVELVGKRYDFYVLNTKSHSLLSVDTCLDLGLLNIRQEWVNVVSSSGVEDILDNYQDVFSGLGSLPGEYQIETDEEAIPRQNHNRKVPQAMKKDLKEKLLTLAKKQIIAKVDYPTPWISNIVSVRKPNGTLRVCIDPSNLNKAIKRNHFPMPTLDDVLSELDGAKVFSLCDAKDGFLQIKLSPDSSDLTTFWTPFGKYKWLRMPFGLSSSPEEFQRRLSEALEGLEGVTVVADDILIYGKGQDKNEAIQDHNTKLERLLQRAQKVQLKLNKEKCRFLLEELPYIGHVISSQGVKPDPKKISAIKQMAAPQDSDGVRRFLGHINYLAKFIPNCSAEAEPLRRLIGTSEKEFVWAEDQKRAFATLKDLATADATLQYFRANEPIVVQTDASTVGLGAVMLQNDKPVCYASRSLTNSERNYAPIELELLAIVYAMQKFDHYVFGNGDVTVHTDHQPLETIMKKPLLTAPKRLQSMMLTLQRYPMKVMYKPGPEQVTADMLSRSPTEEATAGVVEQQIFSVNPLQDTTVSEETYEMIRSATKEEPELQVVAGLVSKGWPKKIEEVPENVKQYYTYRDELSLLDGIVYKGSKLVVPKGCRPSILRKLHVSHQGVAATIRRARGAVFWPCMATDIRTHIDGCVTCSLDAPLQQKETLQNHDIPSNAWSKVGMDLLTYNSKNYLIMVDYFSDFFECESLKTTNASAVIKACKKTFARYGIPIQVNSDNGPQFTSAGFRQFSKEWGFQHTTSSPGHQQSNGKAEAAVKIIKRIMKRADDPYLALLEYRNTPTAGLSTSPVQRMLGKSTRSILPTNFDNQPNNLQSRVLKEKADKKAATQKSYDKSAKDLNTLKVGAPVLLRDFQSAKVRWQRGKIVEQLSDRSYAILSEDTSNIVRRNRVDIRSTTAGEEPRLPGEGEVPTEELKDFDDNRDANLSGNTADEQEDVAGDTHQMLADAATAGRAGSSRSRSMPVRFKDYIMY